MNPSRRRLLSALALSASFSGCLGRTPSDADGSDPTNAPTETTESATASTTTTEPATASTTEPTRTETTMDDGVYEPRRATGEPTSIETAIENEDLEYLPETDVIRYVAAYRAPSDEAIERGTTAREPVYETIPFERWARTECLSIGAKAVNEALDERLDGGARGIGAGVGRMDGEPKRRIGVRAETLLNREGEVISKPSVGFDEVVAATPREVEVTFSFAGTERSCTEPVFVREATIQEE